MNNEGAAQSLNDGRLNIVAPFFACTAAFTSVMEPAFSTPRTSMRGLDFLYHTLVGRSIDHRRSSVCLLATGSLGGEDTATSVENWQGRYDGPRGQALAAAGFVPLALRPYNAGGGGSAPRYSSTARFF